MSNQTSLSVLDIRKKNQTNKAEEIVKICEEINKTENNNNKKQKIKETKR